MRRLRAPDGCPWDREQTLETLRAYVLEEAYEVLEAIDRGDQGGLREEIGDLLLEVVFLSQVCAEKGWFDAADVAQSIADKLIRRHPHVFGEHRARDSKEAIRHWEEIKKSEREASGQRVSLLDGVPRQLPALLRAARLSSRAGTAGFDWTALPELMRKLEEEVDEFREAASRDDRNAMTEELGDLLFIASNVGRFCGIDPESALQRANAKFIARFQHIESRLREQGREVKGSTMEEMESLWEEAKRLEREGQPE